MPERVKKFNSSGTDQVLKLVRDALAEKFPNLADGEAFITEKLQDKVPDPDNILPNLINALRGEKYDTDMLANIFLLGLDALSDLQIDHAVVENLIHNGPEERVPINETTAAGIGTLPPEDSRNFVVAAKSPDPKEAEETRRRGRPVTARPHMGNNHLIADRRRKPKRRRPRRQSVELGPLRKQLKPLDETKNTFRQRVRDPSRFSVLRTITITEGVRAVVGRLKGQTTTKIQTLIFSKKQFPTRESVHEWIRNHPDIVKSEKESWRALAKSVIPLSGQLFPFVIHATFEGIPDKEKSKPFAILAKKYPCKIDFRFGTDKTSGFFGFRSTAVQVKNALDISDIRVFPRDVGPAFWLTKGEEAIAVGAFPPTRTWIRRYVLDKGEYRINFATPECLSLRIAGETLKGDVEFSFVPGVGWVFLSGLPKPSIGTTASWVDKGFSWVVAPEGTVHTIVDVAKELGRKLDSYSIIKSSDEKRFTLGIAYPANRLDSDKDWATIETVEKAAWTFLSRANVGLFHSEGTDGAGIPVESYIYRGPDWTIERTDEDGNVIAKETVKAGDWLLGVIWNEEAWDLIKQGKVTGYSLQGTATRRVRELVNALQESQSDKQ